MRGIEIDTSKLSNTEIAQMFSDYVNRMQDTERHTEAACKEADAFDLCCSSEFPNNVRLQNLMWEKMMNVAVEFEESGFIAGFKTAMAFLSGQEEYLFQPTQISTLEEEKSLHKAVNEPQEEVIMVDTANKDCITTKQIAEMFETTNFKVVRRIEKQILPHLDAESKKYFDKVVGKNIQHKPITFYRLNKAACQLYLKEIEPKRKNFINIAGGYAKLQELMEMVFPAEVRVVTV